MQESNPELAQTWDGLQQGVHQVLTNLENGFTNQRYMTLYTSIYNYCTSTDNPSNLGISGAPSKSGVAMKGGHLYHKLTHFLKESMQNLKLKTDTYSDESLLRFYVEEWQKFTVAGNFIHKLFSYLNRYWVSREIDESHRNIYDIYTLTLVSWRDNLFMAIHPNLMTVVLDLIERQRNGEMINAGLIKQLVSNFVSLGLDETDFKKQTLNEYAKHFQVPFLAATEGFYKEESENFISENNVMDYMKKAEIRLEEEEGRVQTYLHPSTRDPLIYTCEIVLIKNHLGPMQDEFQNLLDNEKNEDLSRMYSLLVRIPNGLDKLREIFEAHVRQQGLNAVEKVAQSAKSAAANDDDEEESTPKTTPVLARKNPAASKPKSSSSEQVDPKVYVEALLLVHKKYSTVVTECFKGESGFVASLDKACREFVNRNHVCKSGSSKSPELLAKFCDSLLKKSSRVAEDGEVEEALNSVMTVFKYVEDKDVFQKFYSQFFAKRLVNTTSSSDDTESSMIGKLKEACGFEYTSKLQRMFTDINLSKELNQAFKEKMETTHEKSEILDFSIVVGSAGQWPLNASPTTFNIPDDLLKTYERLQSFYTSKHSGRKLNWLFHLSKGEIKTSYLKASKAGYTFQVSTYQMGILLQYNNNTVFTFEDLLSRTGMTPESLTGNLALLMKFKILLLEPNTGKVGTNGSRYSLNMDFKSKKIRINLNMAIRSEAKQENEETHKNVEEDRKILIQAAIVRIMKTRKALKHVTLIEEVISQLTNRFRPKIPDIKKCIDILLEKEYIERHKDAKDMYSYVA